MYLRLENAVPGGIPHPDPTLYIWPKYPTEAGQVAWLMHDIAMSIHCPVCCSRLTLNVPMAGFARTPSSSTTRCSHYQRLYLTLCSFTREDRKFYRSPLYLFSSSLLQCIIVPLPFPSSSHLCCL